MGSPESLILGVGALAAMPRTTLANDCRRSSSTVVAIAALVAMALVSMACNSGPHPVADVTEPGPRALLVGSDFPEGRLAVLDTQGRILAVGAGAGSVAALAVCPGGRRVAEITWSVEDGPRIAIRDLETLQLVQEIGPGRVASDTGGASQITCRDEAGENVVVLVSGQGLVALGSDAGPLASGAWSWGVLTPEHAFLVPEKGRVGVDIVDLSDGRERTLYELPTSGKALGDISSIAISPAGDRVAVVDWITAPQHVHTLRLFSLPEGIPMYQRTYPGHGGSTTAWWVDDETLLLAFLGDGDAGGEAIWGTAIRLDAADGAEIGRWRGLDVNPLLAADGVLIGTPVADLPGVLAAVPAVGGHSAVVRAFETELVPGIHGEYRAPISAVAVLAAFEGATLLAATDQAPLSAVPTDQGLSPVIALVALAVLALLVIVSVVVR